MKALTLYQPWASLVAVGEKRYETRAWTTRYRGPLAIHAGQERAALRDFVGIMATALGRHGLLEPARNGQIVTGAVVCIVELEEVYETAAISQNMGQTELALGDWSPGRFAWKLKLVEILRPPVPARGGQRLWNWRAAWSMRS